VAGVLVSVHRDWLDLVERESPVSFALPRADTSQPSWAEPGAIWYLAVGEPQAAVVASAVFVEHELLTAQEAFDRFGYGTGALSVENALAQRRRADATARPDSLVGWAVLEELEAVTPPIGERALRGLGIVPAGPGELVRLDDAQSAALAVEEP
jgi:hypothetical protein